MSYCEGGTRASVRAVAVPHSITIDAVPVLGGSDVSLFLLSSSSSSSPHLSHFMGGSTLLLLLLLLVVVVVVAYYGVWYQWRLRRQQ